MWFYSDVCALESTGTWGGGLFGEAIVAFGVFRSRCLKTSAHSTRVGVPNSGLQCLLANVPLQIVG